MKRKLGTNQEGMFRALLGHGYWHGSCGWTWGGRRNTECLLDSLVRRGLVTQDSEGTYWPISRGDEDQRQVEPA